MVRQLSEMGLFEKKDVIFSDVRYKQFANVMFTPSIYGARNSIHCFLQEQDINYAGRWGEWDYLWVGQSYRSGVKAAELVLQSIL